jgi:hypothetical protein
MIIIKRRCPICASLLYVNMFSNSIVCNKCGSSLRPKATSSFVITYLISTTFLTTIINYYAPFEYMNPFLFICYLALLFIGAFMAGAYTQKYVPVET